MTFDAAPPDAFTTEPPQIGEAEARDLARDLFGVTGRVAKLASERDANFHVAAEGGPGFVLKVGNAAEDPAITEFQTRALRHIAARAPGLPVPLVHRSRDGADEARHTIAAGSLHVVRLLTYLPGEPQHRTLPSPAQASGLGRCLAALGCALRDFRHPAADHDILWDLKRAVRLRALLPSVAPAHRARVAHALDRFEAEVLPRLGGLRRQVVHNDLNPHNVLVDPTAPHRVVGVLDFGDLVETPLVCDVAIAAAYQVGCPDMPGQIASFVGAYHAVSPLTHDEIDVLPDLVALRQATTLLIAGWRADLYPGNRSYILRNAPRAAAALDRLDAIGRPAILTRLRQACALE